MKRTASLFLAALALCAMTCPALAAEMPQAETPATETAAPALYPAEVSEYAEGDARRISKIYILAAEDDPADIPTVAFEREDYVYALLDLTRQDNAKTDAKLHTKPVTVDSKSKELEQILPLLPTTKEITTEDGYTGVLTLDATTIKVEAAGYGTSSRTVTATRSYPNLSDADTAFVPKTTDDSGRTLELADVQWQEAGGFYHATATYTGTATSKYATGYTVTASYSGEVSKTTSDTLTYTAIFGGTPISAEEMAETIGGWNGLLIVPVSLCAAGLAGLCLFLNKKYKAKKGWKEFSK